MSIIKRINPRRVVINPVDPLRRIATMPAIPVDISNKAFSKKIKRISKEPRRDFPL